MNEPGPGLVYLFDAQGRLLGGKPMASTGAGVGLTYSAVTGTYQLVRLVGRELRRAELRL